MIDKLFLQSVLNDEIPITQALGIEVKQLCDHSIQISAPLSSNINHKSTAFGGSLYSVAVLAGWGLIYSLLDKHNIYAHIVIQESKIRYLKPVKQDILAQCDIGDSSTVENKIALFKRKGLSRISLDVEIYNQDQLAVSFTGQYVIHR